MRRCWFFSSTFFLIYGGGGVDIDNVLICWGCVPVQMVMIGVVFRLEFDDFTPKAIVLDDVVISSF